MNPGEVSFKSMKAVRRIECFARDNKILNRLSKTRVEIFENVEELLHQGKKSRDPNFFTNYIANNRELLIEQEKERRQAKKNKKKIKSQNSDSDFEYTDD